MKFVDWGLIDYRQAWDKQREIAGQLLALKDAPDENVSQIIFCEHPHVYTLGRNGNAGNFLINDEFLERIHATYHKVDRGGDITYHGPQQIVGYPILDLERLHIGLKEYIFKIETVIIHTLQHYHINAERLAGATGVWIDADKPAARKICAIGVHASRFITTHGFALNVNTDLTYYNHINPCGFVDKGVTSIQKETGHAVDMEEVKSWLRKYFTEELNVD